MLRPGGSVFGLTGGHYSLLDLLGALLAKTGPADVRLSTWSTGIRDAENAARLLDAGAIRTLRLYTDGSFPTRQPQYCARIVTLFGADAIRCSNMHAKVATVVNDAWACVVRSSMNLNRNPRFEQFDVDDNRELAAFVGGWFDVLDRLCPPGLVFERSESVAAFEAALRAGITTAQAVAAVMADEEAPAPRRSSPAAEALRARARALRGRDGE